MSVSIGYVRSMKKNTTGLWIAFSEIACRLHESKKMRKEYICCTIYHSTAEYSAYAKVVRSVILKGVLEKRRKYK